MLPVYRDRLASWGGVTRAVPLAGDGEVLAVRTDKLKDPALQEKFLTKFGRPLPATPATWEDVAEIAEAGAELGRPLLSARSASVKSSARDFFRVAACYDRPALTEAERKDGTASVGLLSFTHAAETGEPRLTAPGFAEAARWLARIEPTRTANADAAAGLAAGTHAIAILPLNDLARAVHEAVVILPLPGTRFAYDAAGAKREFAGRSNYVPWYGGGWFGVVRAKCTHTDAAFDLLLDLAGPARSLELLSDPELGFGPFRSEHLEQSRDSLWQGYGYDAARTRQIAEALRRNASSVVNPAFGLRGPDAAELLSLLNGSLNDLPNAQAAWQRHDAKHPEAKAWRRHAAGLK